jgi:hypothetical protein
MTEHRWQGSALLRPCVLAFIGSIGATDRHAHHAVQIITATTALTVVDGTDVRHCLLSYGIIRSAAKAMLQPTLESCGRCLQLAGAGRPT